MGCIPSDHTPPCLSVAPYRLPICHQTPRCVRQGPSSAPLAASLLAPRAQLSHLLPAPVHSAPVLTCASAQTTLWGCDSSSFPCLPPGETCLVLLSLNSVPLPLASVSTDAPDSVLPLDHGPGYRPYGVSRTLGAGCWVAQTADAQRTLAFQRGAGTQPAARGRADSSLLNGIRERTF